MSLRRPRTQPRRRQAPDPTDSRQDRRKDYETGPQRAGAIEDLWLNRNRVLFRAFQTYGAPESRIVVYLRAFDEHEGKAPLSSITRFIRSSCRLTLLRDSVRFSRFGAIGWRFGVVMLVSCPLNK